MAISQAVAGAIVNQPAPDIMGSFQRGQDQSLQRQERARQDKIRELSGMAAQGEEGAMGELSGLAPGVAFKIREAMGAEDDRAAERFLQDAPTLGAGAPQRRQLSDLLNGLANRLMELSLIRSKR